MNLQTLSKMIELIFAILSIIVSTYVIPYVKSRYEENELIKLKEYIVLGIRCAEMYFDTTDGKAKKEYVMNYIKGIIGDIVHTDITDEQLDILVEGLVQQTKYGFSEIL